MKYKTTIRIITDARDKHEAMDLVGEYLSGHISSGIDMKCATRPANAVTKGVVCFLVGTLFVGIGVLTVVQMKSPQKFLVDMPGFSTVQPVLKTSQASKDAEFKKAWSLKQAQEAMRHLVKQ